MRLIQNKKTIKNKKKRIGVSLRKREARLAYLMIIPMLVIILLIILFPMFWNVVLSFQPIRLKDLRNFNLLDFSQIEFSNYTIALGKRFSVGLKVTLIYAFFSTIVSIGIGLWAAMVAREKFLGRKYFRTFILFPYIAPLVSCAFIWRLIFDKHIGIFNVFWMMLGNEPIGWLTTQHIPITFLGIEFSLPLALIVVIIFEGWRYFPFAYLFILSRLQAIPDDLYDAAKVDGACPSQRFWFITLPELKIVFGTIFLIRFIYSFFKFGDIFLLNGGTAGTEVLSIQIYSWLFARRNVGVAAAIGVLLALILVSMAIFYSNWLKKQEN